jgi:hypothetical protein
MTRSLPHQARPPPDGLQQGRSSGSGPVVIVAPGAIWEAAIGRTPAQQARTPPTRAFRSLKLMEGRGRKRPRRVPYQAKTNGPLRAKLDTLLVVRSFAAGADACRFAEGRDP